ncbi:hypothetical protein CSHISOI_11659 [Colletotrichum shisoi]|uniref:Cyanovirin-N domain-containing protein n=1 Tax=Colletotrichum shisoi TaxID=2078593 RepID=A0A5Q4BA10_9PEZI|nr:hypothetical protein CSHISOI_11659 [Colletotrichum shisoi]
MQLPSLATASTFVLLALVKPSLACGGYLYFHCYNSDGKPNDAATQTVCDRFNDGDTQMIDANQWSDGARECEYIGVEGEVRKGIWHPFAFNNCDVRVMCGEAGATGGDSSCRDKPPRGPDRYKAGVIVVGHN